MRKSYLLGLMVMFIGCAAANDANAAKVLYYVHAIHVESKSPTKSTFRIDKNFPPSVQLWFRLPSGNAYDSEVDFGVNASVPKEYNDSATYALKVNKIVFYDASEKQLQTAVNLPAYKKVSDKLQSINNVISGVEPFNFSTEKSFSASGSVVLSDPPKKLFLEYDMDVIVDENRAEKLTGVIPMERQSRGMSFFEWTHRKK